MPKFEYKIVHQICFRSVLHQQHADEETLWLNEQGVEGWELFEYRFLNGSTDLYKFKRRVIDNESFQKKKDCDLPAPGTPVYVWCEGEDTCSSWFFIEKQGNYFKASEELPIHKSTSACFDYMSLTLPEQFKK